MATSDPGAALAALPRSVHLREVGPRDGLQREQPLAPVARASLVLQLAEAGCTHIEAVSFVSERAVPAMAGAAEVLKLVRAGLAARASNPTITGLVPNRRGAEGALEARCDELSVTISASPAYNEKNVRRTIEESVEEIGSIVELAGSKKVPVDAVVSCAFGSPYEAVIEPGFVAELASRLVELGCEGLTLADTTGVATPVVLARVLEAVRDKAPHLEVGLHLHESRGTALLNAYAGLVLGVSRFDTAVGGLGGSPFAEDAGGNLSTEDFVALLESLGIESGVRLDPLLEIAAELFHLVGHDIASRVRRKPS